MTVEDIRRCIEADTLSDRKKQAETGQRYYEADHDILKYRMFYYNTDGILVEDKARSNSRICHPFFTELVDQLAAYIVSFDENPIQAKSTAEGLQDHLDEYFDDVFWGEIEKLISGTVTKGFDYLYGYKNAEDRLTFQYADGMGVVEVRQKDTDDNCEYIIYWYVDRIGKENKKIKRIQVHDNAQITYYVQVDNDSIVLDDDVELNPRPNVVWTDAKGHRYADALGFIPFWRLDNNQKQQSGLKPIKGLIDDYDLMQCGLSNNLQDFDTPIHLVKGYEGDNLTELQQNIKTKKILGVSDTGGLDILTVDIPYQARKTKADEDEKNIYRFGMGFNSSQSGDGNITNVVIRSRYTLLDLKAKKLIKRLKAFLKGIINVVLDEINTNNGTDYRYTDVKIDFRPVVPVNEQENAQNAKTEAETRQIEVNTILNVAANVGDEQVLKSICDILELDFDELKGQLNDPNSVENAEATLEGVITDEQPAKISSTAILEQ